MPIDTVVEKLKHETQFLHSLKTHPLSWVAQTMCLTQLWFQLVNLVLFVHWGDLVPLGFLFVFVLRHSPDKTTEWIQFAKTLPGQHKIDGMN